MICANCNKDIEGSYFKCLDNYIQVKYFEEQDESDNVFCSRECFCKALSVEEIDIPSDTEDEEDGGMIYA